MKILLTGCSGYIGSRLAPLLRDAGHSVVGLDRERYQGQALDTFIHCDLMEPERYRDVLGGIEYICHLAAAKGDWGISDREYDRDNVQATRSLVEAARGAGIGRWLFYSTVSVLGPSTAPLDETAPRRPVNAYGRSKAACEALLEEYVAEVPGAHVVSLRPSVVFGPGNPDNTNIYRLIDAIYRRRFLMVGRGHGVKATSYIENLLDAHMFLMDRQLESAGSGHEVYHYVDAPGESTGTLVERIHRALGLKHPRLRLPLALAYPAALAGDAIAWVTNRDLPITSARVRKFCTPTNFSAARIRELGFSQRVANDEAMRRTVEWYLDRPT